MLAVANFASDATTRRWSVLEVTDVIPTHYALQDGSGGFPGFVVEAARSAAQDWESQATESTEETTKIVVTAIPTFLEISEPEGLLDEQLCIRPESNVAMLGSRVRSLDTELTNRIANNGIDTDNERNLAEIGKLARNSEVDVLIRIEDLLRTHFAIFGFTGVGKSNLLSTIVAKVFESSQDPVKLVLFDLMGEYSGLLIDQLQSVNVRTRMLTVGRNTLPEGTFRYINRLPGAPNDKPEQQVSYYGILCCQRHCKASETSLDMHFKIPLSPVSGATSMKLKARPSGTSSSLTKSSGRAIDRGVRESSRGAAMWLRMPLERQTSLATTRTFE